MSNKYKFSIGQKIKIAIYHPWVGDYDASATIIGFGNVFINAVPTYKIKFDNGMERNTVVESEIKLDEHSK